MDSPPCNFRRPMIATSVPSSIASASSNAKSIYNRVIANESTLRIVSVLYKIKSKMHRLHT